MLELKRGLALAGLAGLLSLSLVGAASASSGPPVVQPKIVGAASAGPCVSTACPMTITLTYNTPVGVTNNAAPDFTVEDVTNEQNCAVVAVTTTPPPTPIVPPLPANALYLRANCLTNPGDVMVLVYRANPAATVGYVYNLQNPSVHALSPQAFAWFNGPVPASGG
jgi:hypothetical protein